MMKTMNMYSVFVYGTLKKSEPNYYLMNEKTEGLCIYKGHAKTVDIYPLVIASRYNIPYILVHAEGKGHVSRTRSQS